MAVSPEEAVQHAVHAIEWAALPLGCGEPLFWSRLPDSRPCTL